MLKQRWLLLVVVVAVVFALGVGIGVVLPRLAKLSLGNRTYSPAILLEQVKTLSQLVTVQYVLEKVIVEDVPPESVLGQMFAGDNRVLMVAHGIVKAGVDLGRLQPGDLQVSGHTLRIKLPPAQITDAYLDDRQTRVVERTTGFLRSFDKDLEQNVRQNAVDSLRRAARTAGILKDADERAHTELKSLFGPLGFEVEFARP
ncbi:exported hypothetical protein [Verrucomicrobia bacterium]|nr:exported hypothetical protein [Verrucomicrobiota bacterium]